MHRKRAQKYAERGHRNAQKEGIELLHKMRRKRAQNCYTECAERGHRNAQKEGIEIRRKRAQNVLLFFYPSILLLFYSFILFLFKKSYI